ncbi:MAG: ZIP family metal transporter [Parcubacteria group bacterium]
MITIYIYTFVSVAVVSLISLVGVFALSLREDVLRKYIFIFMSIAVGALLGDAFIHLIPEALEDSTNATLTSILVIVGIIFFFILEKFLHWHHHGEDKEEIGIHPVGKLMLLSDGVHNFLDGIIIGASFMISVPVGIATTLAVILHEIPQEIGDFAVLLHSGYTKRRALWLNFLSALTAILGAIVFFVLGEVAEASSMYFIPIAAGGFIYIAVADLIPELHKTKEIKHSVFQLMAVTLGVLAMIGLTFLE